ncbi:cilia- and flagella-associated protein 43 [Sitophilus oryzae]|uniref:Cilia- and flagella-associated protein 43 n=1 Tax=Sitophilus oryzae TaxID=7048 RepID=A0A6J2YYH0_SITOR|nr:cilia- and flagella-associated protein 43 [Sitophilus oryzae]
MMKASDSKSLWAKVGQIKELHFMSKNVILFGRGCFIQFINITTSEEHQLMLNNHYVNGDGVKCLTGHSTLYIFAYAENCHEPFIYVRSYPEFIILAKLPGPAEGCKCLDFSETSLLFELGELPNHTVGAWNWRTLEKFAHSSNQLVYKNQVLRCSYGRPIFLAHLGIGSNNMYIWDVFTVCKSSIFSKHEIHLGKLKPAPFLDVLWTTDAICYIVDAKGTIYTYDRDFYLEVVIEVNEEGDIPTSMCWFQHGLTVIGPIPEIKHYKKVVGDWVCDWKYPISNKLTGVICNRFDKCVAISSENEIVLLGNTPESFTVLNPNKSHYTNICPIEPGGEYFVVLRGNNDLIIYRIDDGEPVSRLLIDCSVTSMASNPEFPFLALGNDRGILQLISVHDVTNPTVIVQVYLADIVLNVTKYFERSHVFVTGNNDNGEYFILRGLPGSKIDVALHLEVKKQIVDFFMVSSQNMIRFFVLPLTSNKFYAGNKVIRYCIVDDKVVSVKEYTFGSSQMLYKMIFPKKGFHKDRMFYVVPFNTRYFQVVETKRGSSVITAIEDIKSGHLLRHFSVGTGKYFSITWGYDGFIMAHSADFDKVVGLCRPHHRNDQGVRKAIINGIGTVVVSLGEDGVLTATQIRKETPDVQLLKEQITEEAAHLKLALMFKRPTAGFPIEACFLGKPWKEIQRLKLIASEEKACRIEKEKIWAEFHDISKTLKALVDQNMETTENKKLDLMEFYLDTALYNKKQLQNKEDCKQTETYLKCLIVAQDKVSNYIIKNYWEPMGIQWGNILGIFSEVKATNYCLLPESQNQLDKLSWVEEQRKVEQFMSSQDTFEPWVWMTQNKLMDVIRRRPMPPREDYTGVAALRRLKEIDEMESEKSLETTIAIAGSVAQLYIDISPGHYQQRQLTTFYQCQLQQAVAEREVIKLKQNYNKCFQNTRAIKDREVYNIKEKNAKLRHIVSEYNYHSDKKVFVNIDDPEWDQIENPETILKVTDNEIPVTPYISPSEQAILDAKAAEEERLRLLLLADDFRERALMAMMNGVLEVRWEDELKKDVPKPKCMLEKIPEEYNEDDLRAIRDYEEKVVFLKAEREKYKTLLEVDYAKLSTNVRDTIRRFNQKLYECTRYKFYIDSGMNQENLQVNRARFQQNHRIILDEIEAGIIASIQEYEKEVDVNHKQIQFMQDSLSDCKTNLDSMQIREKNLEKAYRKDFQDMSPVVQEQSYKLYKKRPKVNFRNISTATVLNELAKSVLSNETTIAMTQECLDYLKSLEQLDLFVGLPPTIDENTYSLICKHRRMRIEYDIRCRAAQLQIIDGDATLSTFQRRIATEKEKIANLNAQLEKTRDDRLYLLHNRQVQVVLRRGLVEIPLTGDLFTDFNDVILIPRTEIQRVNDMIKNAGNLKLKTIYKNMEFKRRIMNIEWEHMKTRMQINDFIEQRKDILSVKFTKEMQRYLKSKTMGKQAEVESYEMEVELLAAAFENRIKDKKDKYNKIKIQLKLYQDSNKNLDEEIKKINVDVCHFKLLKEWEVEEKEKSILKSRLNAMLQRNQLVQKIQENHNEILVLQAELELLRLRTFPTFKYKVLDQ